MGFSWLWLWGIILINSLCLIVEATLRKDRSRYRPFPLAVAAFPSSALLLPCPSRGKPPEGFFRGCGLLLSPMERGASTLEGLRLPVSPCVIVEP